MDLPEELIDLVFRRVGDDRSTLAAGSQVCRTWMACARPYVFKHATVRCYVEPHPHWSVIAKRTPKDLVVFLRDSPHLVQHIVSLDLTSDYKSKNAYTESLDFCALRDIL